MLKIGTTTERKKSVYGAGAMATVIVTCVFYTMVPKTPNNRFKRIVPPGLPLNQMLDGRFNRIKPAVLHGYAPSFWQGLKGE